MAWELRRAGSAEEVEQVRELMREYGAHLASHPAGPEHFCLEGFEEELADLPGEYTVLLLATVEGLAAGCVALRPLAAAGDERRMEIKRLWVRPRFRGMGLGRGLMEAAIERARAADAGALLLDTVPSAMAEANALYAAMGFRPTARYSDTAVCGVEFFRLELR